MNANTSVVVTSPLPEGALLLRRLRLDEALGRPYELELELATPGFDLDLGALVGRPLGVRVTRPDGSTRDFHGRVAAIEAAGATERFGLWRASLRPGLWFLKDAVDSRVFQHRSVPQIVKDDILKARGIDDVEERLTASYAPREYCVQYGESALDFMHRLLEEEGIYYYFRHEQDKHVLVLCDSPQAHVEAGSVDYRPQGRPGLDAVEGLFSWSEAHEVVPGAVAIRDFDYAKPDVLLEGRASQQPSSTQDLERFDYPAGFAENADGTARARIRLAALQAGRKCFRGEGNPFALGAGCRFNLARHERLAAAYVVTQAAHELVSEELEHGAAEEAASFRIASRFTAIPAETPYHPPRVTPRAVVRGPQTAVVQGPAGQEVHVDEMGRVKIRFFWDRLGAHDDTASCWVRVSQGAAGRHFGHVAVPRVGEEVVVDFLDGDPDRPIVTGRVYNAACTVPLDLPAQKTRSTIRTRSTPGGGEDNFNELRFEDKTGEEEIYLHAERNFTRVVENDDVLRVGFDKKANGDQRIDIHNNQTIAVGASGCADGSRRLTVWKDRETTVKTGDDHLTLEQGGRTATIARDDVLTVKQGDRSVKVEAGKYAVEAAVSITFKVGENSLTIDQSGITIKALQVKVEGETGVKVQGLQVKVEATTALELAALCTKVDSQALLTMKGALVQIN
jgi:type VI secretion system secreted protein VgrG